MLFRIASISALALFLGRDVHAEPEQHLLAGAHAFQAGRFEEALSEFRAAEKDPAGRRATWYLAATFFKLGDFERALDTFLDADAAVPEQRDELLDFYFASAFAEARLYTAAEKRLAQVAPRAGPKIAALSEKMRADMAQVLAAEPPHEAIDWYEAQGLDALVRKKPRLARAYFEEAAACGRRARPEYRVEEALEGIRRADAQLKEGAP